MLANFFLNFTCVPVETRGVVSNERALRISCGTGLEAGPEVGYTDTFAILENWAFSLTSEPNQPNIVFPGLFAFSCLILD